MAQSLFISLSTVIGSLLVTAAFVLLYFRERHKLLWLPSLGWFFLFLGDFLALILPNGFSHPVYLLFLLITIILVLQASISVRKRQVPLSMYILAGVALLLVLLLSTDRFYGQWGTSTLAVLFLLLFPGTGYLVSDHPSYRRFDVFLVRSFFVTWGLLEAIQLADVLSVHNLPVPLAISIVQFASGISILNLIHNYVPETTIPAPQIQAVWKNLPYGEVLIHLPADGTAPIVLAANNKACEILLLNPTGSEENHLPDFYDEAGNILSLPDLPSHPTRVHFFQQSDHRVDFNTEVIPAGEGQSREYLIRFTPCADFGEGNLESDAQEQLYRLLIAGSRDPLVVTRDNKILMVNPAYEELYNSEVLAIRDVDRLIQLFDQNTVEIIEGYRSQVFNESSGPKMLELTGLFREMKSVMMEIQSYPISWIDGKPATITVLHDIGRSKESERERNRLYRAKIEAEQARSQRLTASQEALHLASVGVVAAEVTHEINQPLNAITLAADGMGHWAKQHPEHLPDFVVNLLKNVGAGAARIRQIIDKLDKLYDPLLAPPLQPVDIRDSARNAIQLTEDTILHHGVTLLAHLPEDALYLQGDPPQLEQLIVNLIMHWLSSKGEQTTDSISLVLSIFCKDNFIFLLSYLADPGTDPLQEETIALNTQVMTMESGLSHGINLAVVSHFTERFGGTLRFSDSQNDKQILLRFPIASREKHGVDES